MRLCVLSIFARFCALFCVFVPTKMACKKKVQIGAEFSKDVQKALLCNTPFSYIPILCVTDLQWQNYSASCLVEECAESVSCEVSLWPLKDECQRKISTNNFAAYLTGGILFREYCFGRENSLSSAANSVSSASNSVSSLWHTNTRPRGTHWARSPELGEPQKTHWVQCLKPYSPKPYLARFRIFAHRWRKIGSMGLLHPEDPAVLKTVRDNELLRRSVFATPPRFTTLWTLLWEETCLQFPGRWCPHKVRRDSKSLRDSKFTMPSKFTTALSF